MLRFKGLLSKKDSANHKKEEKIVHVEKTERYFWADESGTLIGGAKWTPAYLAEMKADRAAEIKALMAQKPISSLSKQSTFSKKPEKPSVNTAETDKVLAEVVEKASQCGNFS